MRAIENETQSSSQASLQEKEKRKRRKVLLLLLLVLLLLGLTFTSVSRFFGNSSRETASTDPRTPAQVEVIETGEEAEIKEDITSLQSMVASLQQSIQELENHDHALPSPGGDLSPQSISYDAYQNLQQNNHINTSAATSILTRGTITNEFFLKTAKLVDISDVNEDGLSDGEILKWDEDENEWVAAKDKDSNTTYEAGNGLTLTDEVFSLGGALTENTELDLAGFSFTFTDGDVTVDDSLYATALYQNGNVVCDMSGNCGGGGVLTLTLAGDSGVNQTISNNDTITISGGAGLTSAGSATDTITLNIGAGNGISVATDTVTVDQSYAFSWTGAQSWSNSADFNGDISIADTNIAFDGASTNFTSSGNFSINTNDFFIQQSDGNIGVGNTSPGYTLDVTGSIATSDDLYISGIGLNDTASNTTSGAYLIGVFDEFTNSNATTLQEVLADLDASITGVSHSPVTLAGSYDYLTLTGQQITLNQIDLTTDVTGILPLANGGTNADLSGVSTGGIIYRGPSGLAGSGSLTGILKGNGSSAPTAITGTSNYVTRWIDANTLGTGILYDNATNVGIGTTTPGSLFDVVGGNIRSDGDVIAGDFYLGYDNLSATLTTFDTDEDLTINPNGTGVIYLHGATYYVDSNGLFYTAGLATTGYTPTAGELRANVFRDGDSAYYIQPADTSISAVFAGNVGIGTTSPDFALQVNGVIAPENANQDIGTSSLRWDVFANEINADNTVTLTGLGTGTDNTVLILNASNQVTTDEIDPRVWGTTLVDGSGNAGYIAYWTDAETLTSEQYLSVIRGGLGGDVTPAGAGEILYSTGTTSYDSLAAGSNGYVLVSGGAGAPTWVDPNSLGASYWTKVAGVLSPALAEPIAASSSATTVATFTATGSNLALQAGGVSEYASFNNVGNLTFTNGSGSTIDASGTLTIGGTSQTGLILGRTSVSTRIANLTTDGVVYTSGTNGTLNTEAQLAIARGGTNSTATPTAGGIAYGDGSAYAFSSAGTIGQAFLSGGVGTPTWGTLGLTYGGTNADLSGVATGGLIYKDASALAGTGALTGVLKGNGASAPTVMTGTTNYVTRWTDANTLGVGILYDDGTNVGIGTTSPDFALQVNGVIAPETTDQDLGTASLRWDLFANTINADNTITLTGLNVGTDNTVLILNGSNQVETREIDPQVWSSDLITGSGTNGYVTYWTGTDTVGAEQYLSTIRGGLGNDITAAGAGEILYSTGTTTYDSLAAGTNGYVLASGGAGSPTWVDPATLGTNFWQYSNGAFSPRAPYTNNTDLLIGSDATEGAKFAVLNIFPGSGTPTASVSSGVNGAGAYLTADGTLATTRRQTLNIGNSSTYNTTGNVLINSNGSGNVGIGTTAPDSMFDVYSPAGAATIAQFVGQSDASNVNVYIKHNSTTDLSNSARLTFQLNTDAQQRTAFEFISGFTDIADATRTSYAYFAGQDGGSYGNRMSIVGSNVGIGNVAPTARLDITGAASTSATLSFRGTTDPKINVLNDENFGIQTSPGGDVGLTERLTILGGGNVGIGSTSPSQLLEVAGEIELANYLYFGNATTEYLRWDGSNFLLSDDFLPVTNDALDLGSDTARWRDIFLGGDTIHLGTSTTDEGTISYNTTTNILGISTDSTTNGDIAFFTDDLFLDKSEGNIGIGTTTPAQALHVMGDVRISGLTASLPVKTNASNDLISGAINLASAEVTGILPLANGGSNADLSGAATGSIIYKGVSALQASGSLTGVLKGNGSSAPTAMTGISNYVTRWTDANTLGTGVIYDNDTNVGIGTTTPSSFLLEVAGSIGPSGNNAYDLGSDTRRWANVYATNFYQNGNAVCDVTGNCASVGNLWQVSGDAISPATPYTNNADLLIGSTATASAKFAVLNIFPGSGTPSASVSSGLSGTSMYMTADGTLATQNRANVTIGNSSTYNTSGNVLINPNGTGNVGIGETAPDSLLEVGGKAHINNVFIGGTPTGGTPNYASYTDSVVGNTNLWLSSRTGGNLYLNGLSGSGNIYMVGAGGSVGIGTTGPAKALDVYGAIRVDNAADEVALVFEDSGGTDTIFHTVNDGQGNYNIMLGVNGDGNHVATGDGTSKMLFTGHSGDGEISLNAGTTGTAGAGVSFNIGLSLDASDQMLRIGNPGDNVGLDGGAGSIIADVNGYLYSERYLYHTGDTNTYLDFPAADTIALTTGGTERVRVLSDGNVGIGTTTVTSGLTVANGPVQITSGGTPSAGVGLELEWDGATSDILSYNRDTASFQPIRLRGSVTSLYTGNTEVLTVASNGNVGISDNTPTQKLDVVGNIRASGQLISTIASGTAPLAVSSTTLVSNLNADRTDGYHAAAYNDFTGSQIVTRHGSGYIFSNYYNMTANDVSSGVTKIPVETGNDGYLRWGDAASVITFLNAGSGLDADTLDGLNSSQFIRNDTDNSVSGSGVEVTFPSAANINTASGDQASLEVYQGTSGADAFMQFHVSGDYAGYFGLDGGINDFVIGGWSYGATSHRVWHAGNDGSGSGLDADVLDGQNLTSASTVSTVVGRDSSGDINARLFRSEYDTTNGSIGYIMTQVNTASDNYIRPSTPAQVRTALDVWVDESGDTMTGALTMSQNGTDVINFSASSTSDTRGIAFNGRSALTADYNDGYLRLNNENASGFTNGVYTPGNLRADGQFHGDTGSTAGAPAFSFTGDTDNGMYYIGTNTVGFSSAGSERIRIASNGNVGIGTATVDYKFKVNGTVHATDTTGTNFGLFGVSTGGAAVYGSTTTGTGVQGVAGSGYGVYGTSTSTTLEAGVYGGNANSGGYGVHGETTSGYGVIGEATGAGTGVRAINSSTGYALYCDATGANKCGGDQAWFNASDRKLKKDIAPIEDGLSKLLNLQGVTYIMKEDPSNTRVMGFIAQDTLPYAPEVVSYDTELDQYGMQTGQLTALIVEAVKQQQTQIENLSGNNLSFDNEGELTLSGSNGNYAVTPVGQSPLATVIGASKAVVGKLTAGLVNTRELVVTKSAQIADLSVTNLKVSGVSLNQYVRNIVQSELQTQPNSLPQDAIAQDFNSGMVIHNYNTTVTIVQSPTASSSTTFSSTSSGALAINPEINVTEVTQVIPDPRFDVLATLISWSDSAVDGVRTLFFNAPTVFRYLAWFQGPVKVNADTSGTITIPADTLKARVSFSKPFPEVPSVYVTFADGVTIAHTITDVNASGFTINFANAPATDLNIQWLALLRDESEEGPSLEVMETNSGSEPATVPSSTPTPAPESSPTSTLEPTATPTPEPTPTPASGSSETATPSATGLSDLLDEETTEEATEPAETASPSGQTP